MVKIKRGVCFFVFFAVFIVLSVSVMSLSVLYSGGIETGQEKYGLTFTVGSDGVYCTKNGDFVIVDSGKCEVIDDKNVCVESVEKIVSGDIANIVIYDKKYDFDITRTVEKNIMYFNEKINVTVNITNKGFLDVSQFLYTDTFPDEIDVIAQGKGNVLGHKFRYVGNLESEESVAFSYFIKPNSKIKASLRGELLINDSYFYSDITTVETKSPVVIKTEVSSKYYKIGEIINYTVFVNNSLNQTTFVNVTIALPDNLLFLDSSNEKKVNFYFKNNTVFNATFKIKCIHTGTNPIKIMTLADNGVKFSIDDILDYFSVSVDKLSLSDNLKTAYTKGENAGVFISFKNSENNISDVFFILKSDLLPNKETVVDNFVSNKTFILFDEDVFIPKNSKDSYYVNITYYFYTQFDEKIEESKIYNITMGSSYNISIIQEISGSLDSGSDVYVSVYLENLMNAPISNIEVHDELESKYFKDGVNINKISLSSKERKKAYEYVLLAPTVLEDTKKGINTFVKYTYANQTVSFNKSVSFTIKPKTYSEKSFKLNIEKSASAPINFSMGDLLYVDYKIENKESSFLKNILLEFPLSEDYETVGKSSYLLQKLDPGEVVYLTGIEKIRPVVNRTISLLPTVVIFQDEYSSKFSSKSNQVTGILVKSNSDFISGPLIFMNNSFVSFLENGAQFKIILINKGTTSADVSLSYNRQREDMKISPKEEKTITYAVKFDGIGNFTIPDVTASYDYLDETHEVLSLGKRIEFLNFVKTNVPQVSETVLESDEEISDEESSDEVISLNNDSKVSLFFSKNLVIVIVVIISIILISFVFYEIKKHKL